LCLRGGATARHVPGPGPSDRADRGGRRRVDAELEVETAVAEGDDVQRALDLLGWADDDLLVIGSGTA
jgi:hypothetical protein